MPGKPNFDSLEIHDGNLVATGSSDDSPLPVDIRVFVEQNGHVGDGNAKFNVDKVTTRWQASFSATGFTKGQPALAFGVEMRTEPFGATSWSQVLKVD